MRERERDFTDRLAALQPGPAPARLDRGVLGTRRGPARGRRGRRRRWFVPAAAALLLLGGALLLLRGRHGEDDFQRRTEELSLRHDLAARRVLLQVRLARLRRAAAGVDGGILGEIEALGRELERLEPPPPAGGGGKKRKEKTGLGRQRGACRDA